MTAVWVGSIPHYLSHAEVVEALAAYGVRPYRFALYKRDAPRDTSHN